MLAEFKEKHGLEPLDVFGIKLDYNKKIWDDEMAKPARRRSQARLRDSMLGMQEAARDAAPYVHSKLAATELSGEIGPPVVIRAPAVAKSTQEWLESSGHAHDALVNERPALPASVEKAANELRELDTLADNLGVSKNSPEYRDEFEKSAEKLRQAIIKPGWGMGPLGH
jgi:hypothetical protein